MNENNNVTVTLPAYRWHRLLDEIEDHLRIYNRNQGPAIELYQDIATQLSDRPVKIIHDQNPDPTFRPVPPLRSPTAEPKSIPLPWWKRMLS